MNVDIQNLTSEVYMLSPEFIEEVAARVEALMAAKKEDDKARREDMRIDARALELD